MNIPDLPHSEKTYMLTVQNGSLQWVPHNPPKSGVWKNLFRSKKAVTAIIATSISVVAAIAKVFEVEIESETLMTTMAPVVAYIVGQGIADHGKEKAKIDKLSIEP